MASVGKSIAQDKLADLISEAHPYATVEQEVYIGDLIERQGYTLKEIQTEMGTKVHRMFVDIVESNSESDIAYEYHGEQHYHKIGNMTATDAELLANQKLDEEKSWILMRIGIPLVAIPYDAYVDEEVIDNLIGVATSELEEMQAEYHICDRCKRRFPISAMPMGCCNACYEKERQKLRDYKPMGPYAVDDDCGYGSSGYDDDDDSGYEGNQGFNTTAPVGSDEWKYAKKAADKARRKAAYQAYKESDAYKEKKEREKAYRKSLNDKRKAERRAAKQAEKRAKRAAAREQAQDTDDFVELQ